MIKGIIFDYGGTLDSGGDHWSEVIWDAYQKAGVAVDKAEFREAYVYAERELARTRHILPEHTFGDLLEIKMKLELEWLSENGHFPPAQVEGMSQKVAALCNESARETVGKAIPVLEALQKEYKMVIVSNFYGNLKTVVEDYGISQYFSDVIESAVVGVRKPDPEIFRLGVKSMGLQPEEVLVVGDSYGKDIAPAASIGCKTVWIKGKGWDSKEEGIDHPAMIEEISQLVDFVGKL